MEKISCLLSVLTTGESHAYVWFRKMLLPEFQRYFENCPVVLPLCSIKFTYLPGFKSVIPSCGYGLIFCIQSHKSSSTSAKMTENDDQNSIDFPPDN